MFPMAWTFTLSIVVNAVVCTVPSNKFKEFDIEPFLDPNIEKQIVPLPLPEGVQAVGSRKLNNGNSNQLESAVRALSLAPTQAFISRRSFNTSCAYTIPLFIFSMPQVADPSTPVHTANQMVYSLFCTMLVAACFVVPIAFTGIRDPTLTGRSSVGTTQGILDRLMSPQPTIDLMGADTKYRIGLDSTTCLLKTICDAHREPQNKEYGLLAVPFQIFFPAPPKDDTIEKLSVVQSAARMGAYEETLCGRKYSCLFDVLDLATYLRNWLLSESSTDVISFNDT